MISVFKIQQKYNDLYTQFRNYIWNYDIVEKFVDLELECYKACPDVLKIRNILTMLESKIHDILMKDEDFKEVFDDFKDTVQEDDTSYYGIHVVNEVIQDENQ